MRNDVKARAKAKAVAKDIKVEIALLLGILTFGTLAFL